MDVWFRPEIPADHGAIRTLTQRAFAPMPFADGDEHELVDRLRDAGALAISLVAERDNAVVGQVTFTPAFAADGSHGWYTLGPVSVEPELQRTGIGSRLIETGLAMLRECDAAGCILVGNPNYYQRFGFRLAPQIAPDDGHAEYFQILPLMGDIPECVIDFHPLFHG